MMILVVDGQGGGLGRLLVRELKGAFPQAEIAAVGTNSAMPISSSARSES